jgi:hypothetical protein
MENKMNWTALMIFIFGFNVALAYGDFVRNPEKYGDIMRRFDEARYHHLDCDCTESLE